MINAPLFKGLYSVQVLEANGNVSFKVSREFHEFFLIGRLTTAAVQCTIETHFSEPWRIGKRPDSPTIDIDLAAILIAQISLDIPATKQREKLGF